MGITFAEFNHIIIKKSDSGDEKNKITAIQMLIL